MHMLGKTPKPGPDPALANALRTYFRTTLHRELRLSDWDGARRLPGFITQKYRIRQGDIGDHSCLFAFDLHPDDDTPAHIRKHISTIEREFAGPVIYVASHVSSTRRSRLMESGISFAVPGNQLYIPELAVDLREVFRAARRRDLEHLSPVAQATLFYSILFRQELEADAARRTPSRIAGTLGYSAMSIGRAFDEVAGFGLADVTIKGRQKILHLDENSQALIEKSREILRSPVQSLKWIVRDSSVQPPLKIAGESALASLTGLSSPDVPVYAIHRDGWALVRKQGLDEVRDREQADATIELWHYRPEVLSTRDTVDPLSLYAQFHDHPDERIAQAAQEILKAVAW